MSVGVFNLVLTCVLVCDPCILVSKEQRFDFIYRLKLHGSIFLERHEDKNNTSCRDLKT
jgi:hypothetical protein